MSPGDIEKRTGLLRCNISRVENGHTVPAIDTLEKMAQALGLPMYRLFIDDAAVHKPNIPSQKNPSRAVNKEHARYLRALTKLFSRISEKNRVLLLHMASKMANSAWQRCCCSFVLCDRSSPELAFRSRAPIHAGRNLVMDSVQTPASVPMRLTNFSLL